LPARAERAGARIELAAPARVKGAFDVVLVDAPCSGSGTWRRSPEAKWRLTPERLAELVALQQTILTEAARHLAPGGTLVYMTCSLLKRENDAQIARFTEDGAWQCVGRRLLTPCDGADGFFGALLRRGEK